MNGAEYIGMKVTYGLSFAVFTGKNPAGTESLNSSCLRLVGVRRRTCGIPPSSGMMQLLNIISLLADIDEDPPMKTCP